MLEKGLNYLFPLAFKELLFLFGGKVFNQMLYGFPRLRSAIVGGSMRVNKIEEDVTILRSVQKHFIKKYYNRFNIYPDKTLFLVNIQEGQLTTIISNKSDDSEVFHFHGLILKEEGRPLTQVFDSEMQYLREDIYSNFFSYHSGKPCYLIIKRELLNRKLFDGWKLTIENSGLHIFSMNVSCV